MERVTTEMDDGDRAAVEALLAAVLERPADEWDSAFGAAEAERPDLAGALRARRRALESHGLLEALAGPREIGAPGEEFGDFVLGEVLGTGAMGVVHLAFQRSLGREVALKLVRPEYALFEASRERFQREAEAVARLGHSSIAQVYAAGEHGGVAYFAMERVDGEDLASLLRRLAGRAPESLVGGDLASAFDGLAWTTAVARVVHDLAGALAHAHERGVLHRDVKPSNVILEDGTGRPVLVDFGLHASFGDGEGERARLTRTGAAPGTLLYMAPEVLERGRSDARSEVYALGATLYELLALQPPFQADSRSATERRIRAGDPDSIRARNRAVSADLEAVTMKALRPEPARRYASMEDFAQDLARVLAGEPVEARPAGRLYRMRRFIGREPRLSAALGMLLALVIGAPTLLWSRERAHAGTLGRALTEEREAKRAAVDLALFSLDVLEIVDPNISADDGPVMERLDAARARIVDHLEGRPEYAALMTAPLAHTLTTLGQMDEARVFLQDSIETLTDAQTEVDPGDTETGRLLLAGTIESRARLCEVLEREGSTEELIEQRTLLVDELKRFHGPDSWRVALARTNLELHRFDAEAAELSGPEAEERLVNLQKSFERVLPSLDSAGDDVAASRAALHGRVGTLLLTRIRSAPQERFAALVAEARGHLERAVTLYDEMGHGGTLRRAECALSLGLAAKYAGELDLAERMYTDAARVFARRIPSDVQRRVIVLVNLSGLVGARGDQARAIDLLEEALGLYAQIAGPDDPTWVQIEGNLLGLLFREGRHEGLAERYGAFVERQIAAFGPNSPMVAYSHERHGLLLAGRGERAAAIAALDRAAGAHAEHGGKDAAEATRVRALAAELRASTEPK